MNNRSNLIILDDFIKIHLTEMEKCRSHYEELFRSFVKTVRNEKSVSRRGSREVIRNLSVDLEEKLENELSGLKERYENQIERLKDLVTNESVEGYYDDELSTGLNSERATSELKGSLLEFTHKLHQKSNKSSFFHN
jgi:hypothetical protein